MRGGLYAVCALWLCVGNALSAPLPEFSAPQQARLVRHYGDQAALRYDAWRRLMTELAGQPVSQQLDKINVFFNQFRFDDDQRLWGENNHWATPMEFIGLGAGDCEDFALAKFLSLQALGVDGDQLRLVYVKALQLDQFHMVLAYYPSAGSVPLVLDNLDGQIRPANERQDLAPIYSFNGKRLWLSGPRGGQVFHNQPALDNWGRFNRRRYQGEMRRPPGLKE
ncbi:transglutaminase-like cysteine peptidase [Ferrimonas gelatinilytica]|uniref:Transglutaminase-like cysteine peptidase n=1 Tax=Ferrimonas gelatinilytica TaxID=1255257 RepID=A0ABP9RV15_9GAMM